MNGQWCGNSDVSPMKHLIVYKKARAIDIAVFVCLSTCFTSSTQQFFCGSIYGGGNTYNVGEFLIARIYLDIYYTPQDLKIDIVDIYHGPNREPF